MHWWKNKKTRLLLGVTAVLVGLIALWVVNQGSRRGPGDSPGYVGPAPVLHPETVTLFFADPQLEFLRDVQTAMDLPTKPLAARVGALWDALKTAPAGENLQALVPSFIQPTAALLDRLGTLYIELGAEQSVHTELGPAWESLMLQSIAHTMTANIARATAVKFLADGRDLQTLGGHLAILYPVSPLPSSLATHPLQPNF